MLKQQCLCICCIVRTTYRLLCKSVESYGEVCTFCSKNNTNFTDGLTICNGREGAGGGHVNKIVCVATTFLLKLTQKSQVLFSNLEVCL